HLVLVNRRKPHPAAVAPWRIVGYKSVVYGRNSPRDAYGDSCCSARAWGLALHTRCCFGFFFFQAEDGIRDWSVTGVQTCALPIYLGRQVARPRRDVQRNRWRSLPMDVSARSCDLASQIGRPRSPSRLSRLPQRSEERRVGKECRSRG